jgi:hypothetical protein
VSLPRPCLGPPDPLERSVAAERFPSMRFCIGGKSTRDTCEHLSVLPYRGRELHRYRIVHLLLRFPNGVRYIDSLLLGRRCRQARLQTTVLKHASVCVFFPFSGNGFLGNYYEKHQNMTWFYLQYKPFTHWIPIGGGVYTTAVKLSLIVAS